MSNVSFLKIGLAFLKIGLAKAHAWLIQLAYLTRRSILQFPIKFESDFNSLTVPQLKAHCKLRGLKGYSKQLKAQLVQRLNEYTNPTVTIPPVPPPPPTTSTLSEYRCLRENKCEYFVRFASVIIKKIISH